MKKPQKAYSHRSQRSWREQWDLESEVAERQPSISMAEERIADLKEKVKTWTETLAAGGLVHRDSLPDALKELEAEKKVLAAAKKQCASFRAKIHALAHPSRSQIAKRTERQIHLARLVRERLENDRAIDRSISSLRALLQSRSEASAKMRAIALALEFSTDDNLLDENRFDLLLDSLPDDAAAESERWTAWFMGRNDQKKRAYIVSREQLTLPETLVGCHYYTDGDTIYLTEAQASRFLADKPWPSIRPARDENSRANFPRRGRMSLKV